MDLSLCDEHLLDLEKALSDEEDQFNDSNLKIQDNLAKLTSVVEDEECDCVSMKIGDYHVQVTLLTGHKKSKINSKIVNLIPPLVLSTEFKLEPDKLDECCPKNILVKYCLKFGMCSKEFFFEVEEMENDDIILGWDILKDLGAQFDFGQSVVRLFCDGNCNVLPLLNKKDVPKMTDVVMDRDIILGPDERCVISFSCPPVPPGTKEVLFAAKDQIKNSNGLDALSSMVKVHKRRIGILLINSKWRKIKINEGKIIGEIRLPTKKLPQTKRRLEDDVVNGNFIKETDYSSKLSKSPIKIQNINELVESILQEQMDELKKKRQKLDDDQKRLMEDEKNIKEKEKKINLFKNFLKNKI